MRTLLLLTFVLSPLFASAQDELEMFPTDEMTQSQEVTPELSNTCGSFSDTACWGRFVGSICQRYGYRQPYGTCSPYGFRDRRGEYSCRCF